MISHEHKCIFIHIPKCAGTSVETAFGHFEGHTGRGGQDHRSIRMIEPVSLLAALRSRSNREELARKLAHRLRRNPNPKNKRTVTRQQYRDYFKFTIVRNPWTRAISVYNNVLRDPIHRREHGLGADVTLAEFLEAHAGKGLLRPQLDWITDWRGTVPLDFICRFEQLEEDFDVVCSRLGTHSITLPKKNVAEREAPAVRFDEDLNRLVSGAYGREIELFGYSAPVPL